ncbi:teichoic acids export ABC transporter ATP-binding subunit TagH [Terrilactibacillus sp. S3-3]|nr:teichoic acids export ABC transporter ATP-binding subunit TagH [Terrilactibacillus sp. S3-3]
MAKSVIVNNITKKYKMYAKTSDKIRDIFSLQGYGEDFYALQNVSFEAEEGDVIGIVGVNGSGKSTLSNIISGVIPPTAGTVETKGQASLIAIASGLNNQLTGLENIELKCLMLGFSKKEIRKLLPDIIEFADIGKFIGQPVKTYSSGMKSRLGFAISVHIDPDILVIDEALSVGDQTFADKCLAKMNEFKAKGKTIFFISHSLGQVKKFCKKALWLEYGRLKAYGPIDEVMPQYEAFFFDYKHLTKEQRIFIQAEARTHQKEAYNAINYKDERKDKLKSFFGQLFWIVASCLALFFSVYYMVDHHQLGMQPQKQIATAAVVAQDHINLRKSNDIYSPVVAKASYGQSFEVLQSKDDARLSLHWLEVKLPNGQKAWLNATDIRTMKVNHKKKMSLLRNIFEADGLPHSMTPMAEWFGKPLDKVKPHIKAQLKKGQDAEGRPVLENNKLTLSSRNGRLSSIEIKGIGTRAETFLKQFGRPLLFNEKRGEYVYLVGKMKIDVKVDFHHHAVKSVIVTKAI